MSWLYLVIQIVQFTALAVGLLFAVWCILQLRKEYRRKPYDQYDNTAPIKGEPVDDYLTQMVRNLSWLAVARNNRLLELWVTWRQSKFTDYEEVNEDLLKGYLHSLDMWMGEVADDIGKLEASGVPMWALKARLLRLAKDVYQCTEEVFDFTPELKERTLQMWVVAEAELGAYGPGRE